MERVLIFSENRKIIMIPNSDELPYSPDELIFSEAESGEIVQLDPNPPDVRGSLKVSLDYLLTRGFEPTYPSYPEARKQARQRLAELLRRSLRLGSNQRDIVQLIIKDPEQFLRTNGEVNQSRVAEHLNLHQTTVRYHLQQLQKFL